MNRQITRKSVTQFLEYIKEHYACYCRSNSRFNKDIDTALEKFRSEDL
jgi:hypothetical protein